MAGLYSVLCWSGVMVHLYDYTIVTGKSNKILSWLHHRMPAFHSPNQFSDWLDQAISPTQALDMLALLRDGD